MNNILFSCFLSLIQLLFSVSTTLVTPYAAVPSNVPQSSQWAMMSAIPSDASGIVEVKADELTFSTAIGSGSFGEVWKGKWRNSDVAIKQIRADAINEKSKSFLVLGIFPIVLTSVRSMCTAAVDDFWREASLVMRLRPHANVVQSLGVCASPLCLVLEFLPGGNVFAYVSDKSKPLNNALVLKWVRGIASVMLHLHLEGVVHRDLAARNVLLTVDNAPKISDFGMSRQLANKEDAQQTKSTVGPLKWFVS
jgi:sterile alpha motif and leucine zipper-containing kinase AZK